MILDGAMVSIGSILLTVYHPGLSFQGNWSNANFSMKGKNRTENEAEKVSTADSTTQL